MPGTRPADQREADNTMALLVAFLVLLYGIPSLLVVPGLGAAGRPASLFSLALLGLWFCLRFTQPTQRSSDPVRWAFFVYLLSFIASYAAGIDRGLPGIEMRSMDRALLAVLGSAGILLTVSDGLVSRDRIERFLLWLVSLGAIGSLIGVVQFAFRVDPTDWIRIPGLELNQEIASIGSRGFGGFARVRGLTRHPIEFGVLAATLLPIAITLAAGKGSRYRWAVTGCIAVSIPLSISRSAALAVVVAMAIVAMGWTWRWRANFFMLGVGLVLAFQVVVPGLLGTIRALFSSADSDPSVAGRTEDYEAAFVYIRERPLLGRGPGTFLPDEYRVLDNQYLGTMIETGWIGLGALLVLLFTAAATCYWIVKRSASADTRALARALGASIIAAIVSSATFDALGFAVYAGTVFVLLGCTAALYRVETTSSQAVRNRRATEPLMFGRAQPSRPG